MTATATVRPTDVTILQSSHMTATVDTASGSHYTVVTRPDVGVVLIHDTKGWVAKGTGLRIIRGRLFLFDKNNQVVAATTVLTNVYIMSN
jgi:hypothetical protein